MEGEGKAFLKKALPFPLQTSPFPSQRLLTGGEAAQQEFLPGNRLGGRDTQGVLL